jgi:hypothetical protein
MTEDEHYIYDVVAEVYKDNIYCSQCLLDGISIFGLYDYVVIRADIGEKIIHCSCCGKRLE